MQPLTLDDLLPLPEYASRRQEFFDAFGRYLDRYRRVRIGPRATLLFENRQTLWFRLHEIIHIARLADERRLRAELNWYNQLLPGRNRLQAALLVHVEEQNKLDDELAPWREFNGEQLRLQLENSSVPAEIVTKRPEDLCIGAAHWLQFPFHFAARQLLADLSRPAFFTLNLPEYKYQSDLLNDEIRNSLLEDLELSDKDAA